LSKRFFFSREYLCKVFKKKYGIGIYEYTTRVRMEKARDMLIDSGLQIQEIFEQLGFSDNNYFSKAFRNYYRVSPSEFREKNGSGDRRKKPDCGIGD
jgi:two-component system response regulator YesN